jgi:hypothetical protein
MVDTTTRATARRDRGIAGADRRQKAHVDKKLQDRDAQQTRDEVLDLLIAIWGLAITVAGLVLGLAPTIWA